MPSLAISRASLVLRMPPSVFLILLAPRECEGFRKVDEMQRIKVSDFLESLDMT